MNVISSNKVSAKNIGYGDLLLKSEPWGELQTFFQSQDLTYTHVCEYQLNHQPGQTMLQRGRWPLDHPQRSKHRWAIPPMNLQSHHSKWSQNHTQRHTHIYIYTPTRCGTPPPARFDRTGVRLVSVGDRVTTLRVRTLRDPSTPLRGQSYRRVTYR